tara:strand:- start:2233 stop:2724 length:492 start_codon:yes stop_codon:yes gene_type:complete
MSKVAIYPGSFDPFTLGHKDIIDRALPLFDKIFVCISESSRKSYLFSLEERQSLIKECLPYKSVEVVTNPGLTAHVAKDLNATYVIRGIRTYMDMEYEKSMDVMNRNLNHQLETIFFFAASHLSSVSSSLVKEVASLGGDISSFVPENILKATLEKVRSYETQ